MGPRRFRIDIRQAGRRLFAAYVLLLAANAALYILLLRPRLATYGAMTTESHPRLQAMRRRETEVTNREAYVTALKRAREDLNGLRTEVLSTRAKRMVPVQVELARLAKQFRINLEQVRYDHEELESEGLRRFAMIVPLEGGYKNLRRFIEAVEESGEFLVIERVALAEGKDGGVLLQLSITLATYFDAPDLRESAPERPPAVRRG